MAPSVFRTVWKRCENMVISKTHTIETIASKTELNRIIPSVVYNFEKNKTTLTISIEIKSDTNPRKVTIGMVRREAGWKYFLRMSAQYTNMSIKILNRDNEPVVRTNSDRKAPNQCGWSSSKANIATGVKLGVHTVGGIKNQTDRQTEVSRIRE
mmetsp:Transcript_23317/g.55145  ORF Transcript_23317/g.55145 Transcript_23317/m.55145 type:complete len:154 (-) Transcript_23317:509-970(-)